MKFSLTAIICLLCLGELYSQVAVDVDAKFVNVDYELQLILINQDVNQLNAQIVDEKESVTVEGKTFTFSSVIVDFTVGERYSVSDDMGFIFDLYFTELPIVRVRTTESIVDEPRVLAMFDMCESDGSVVSSRIGIEYRGGSTSFFPKPSYRLEFWADDIGEVKEDYSLLGMRNDDDWNMDAMYNEPLRLRNKVNFEIWRSIDELYYSALKPKAINGVRHEYVEVFLDDEYQGVYTLGERVDPKQLQLEDELDGLIKGELYKGVDFGGTQFSQYSGYNNNQELWEGFKYKSPTETYDWWNIYSFIVFVIDAQNGIFYNHYESKFNIENLVNYYLFHSVLRAVDNSGKNVYIAKYTNGEPYIYVPWDLDGTFGMSWDGTRISPRRITLHTESGFYSRLILDTRDNGFQERLISRWAELRSSVITPDAIKDLIEKEFHYLQLNAVYEREELRWEDSFLDESSIQYTFDWIDERFIVLDSVFSSIESLTVGLEPIDVEEVSFIVFPNPSTSKLYFYLDDNENRVKTIEIFNSLGQRVETKEVLEGENTIDISTCERGPHYLIFYFNDGRKEVRQVIFSN